MYTTTTKFNTKIHIFDTKGIEGIDVQLTSSSKTAPLSTLRFDHNDGHEYVELCRINGGLFDMNSGANYGMPSGHEVSDVHNIRVDKQDGRQDVIRLKDGFYLVGDYSASELQNKDIQWAYSVDAQVIKDGVDVALMPEWRVSIFNSKAARTMWGYRLDGSHVFVVTEATAGLTGNECRDILKQLGCYQGFMNDGGGSSEMIIDGKIKNSISTERRIRNALVVYRRVKKDPSKSTIVLDGGHVEGYNKYVVSGFSEGTQMFKLQNYLRDELTKYGFNVVVTRNSVLEDPALDSRGKMAKGADLFISLHSNAVGSGGSSSVKGTEIYYSLSDTVRGKQLADKLGEKISYIMNHTYRGSKTRAYPNTTNVDYYGVMRSAVNVGCKSAFLIEHGFHTNLEDATFLTIEDNLKKLAKEEATIIANHFGLDEIVEEEKEEEDNSGLTLITGQPIATAEQMSKYLLSINNSADGITASTYVDMYLELGKTEGIRGDIAFAQSLLETGNFTFKGSKVTFSQNNFCGMGVTSSAITGNTFDSPVIGILAQIQHLKAYANNEPLKLDCVDPRFKYVTRGSAKYVEWLGIQENPEGKGWASGADYGKKILGILEKILAIKVEPTPEPEENPCEKYLKELGELREEVQRVTNENLILKTELSAVREKNDFLTKELKKYIMK